MGRSLFGPAVPPMRPPGWQPRRAGSRHATSSFVGEGVEVVVERNSSSKRNRTQQPEALQDGRPTTGYNSGAIFDFRPTDLQGEGVEDLLP
jgi:hypothetical protein